jgi:enoyl-CoA hydratase/carnithine racemase
MPSVRLLEEDGDIGVMEVNHPPLNLFDATLINDLIRTLEEAEGEPFRALIVRAEGKVFTGGVDVKIFDDRTPAQAKSLFSDFVKIVHKLEALPYPTIASVHGLCLTAGLEMSLGCDVLFASESAKFGLVERVIGLTPVMGGTQRFADRAGAARAREFVMSGDIYDAKTLESWNVVNRVLPDDELKDATLKFARHLAVGPTKAHLATRAIVASYLKGGVPAADEDMFEIGSRLFETEDLQNGIDTFIAEGPGKATFKGR